MPDKKSDTTTSKNSITWSSYPAPDSSSAVFRLRLKRLRPDGVAWSPSSKTDFRRAKASWRRLNLDKDRDEIFALAAGKKYRAFVSRTVPAAEVADATRHLESGKG